jgi:hypothetical protein
VATFGYDYATSTVRLDNLSDDPQPSTYDLCQGHAGRLAPPRGWHLHDLRNGGNQHLDAMAG